MKATTFGVAFLAFACGTQAATKHKQGWEYHTIEQVTPNELKSQGCFTSQGNLTEYSMPKNDEGVTENVSSGNCNVMCRSKKQYVMATHGNSCYCGMVYPEKKSRTDDEACDFPCQAYDLEPCGNLSPESAWNVFNTGIEIDVGFYEKPKEETTTKSSEPTSATSTEGPTSAASTTDPGATEDPATGPTTSNAPAEDGEQKEGNTNVAGIAAGVVVGVVVIAALIGGGFFYMKRRRNAEIEEEHRRNAAVNAFISGAKPPGSSGGLSMSDSRLEPGLAHRRLSDGSIADNQDYSRKILRVTNA